MHITSAFRVGFDSIGVVWRRLARNTSGVSLVEFAVGFPLLLSTSLVAVDLTRLAIVHNQVSQIALNLADNMSRMGVPNGNTLQLREIDVNDAFEAVRDQGASINFVTNGRVILSSLEFQSGGAQRIRWQRCLGLRSGPGYDSSYGLATPLTTAGTTTSTGDQGVLAPSGMGPAGSMINAPEGSAVMFVEVNYLHTPYFRWLFNQSRIHYVASFIVRDARDLSRIYNPNPAATRATCNLYTT